MRFIKHSPMPAQPVMTDHQRCEREHCIQLMITAIAYDDRLVFEDRNEVLIYVETVAPIRHSILDRFPLTQRDAERITDEAIRLSTGVYRYVGGDP